MALLAHQGGWDELLLTAGLVLAMLGVSRLRRRGARKPTPPTPRSAPSPTANSCAFCAAPLAPEDVRCPSCGFRTGEASREPDPGGSHPR
jgi:hypothetical protein